LLKLLGFLHCYFFIPAHRISFIFCPQISCDAKDKILHILALLKFELIQKKVLIFVNSIDMAFRLRLILEKVNQTTALCYYPYNVIDHLDL
jgi:hypothetical protein